MVLFSRLPFHQVLVASLLGVISGIYIFAPGIIDFAKQQKLNEEAQTAEPNTVDWKTSENN